jgi:hypothetical protein
MATALLSGMGMSRAMTVTLLLSAAGAQGLPGQRVRTFGICAETSHAERHGFILAITMGAGSR